MNYYIEDSLKKFEELPLEVILTIDNEEIAKIIEEMNKAYKVDLYPVVIFLSVGDLDEKDVPDYLKREFGVSDIAIERIISEFKERVLQKLEKRLYFLSDDANKNMGVKEEKEIIVDIFKTNLLEEINNHPVIVEAVNNRIFNVFSQDLKFKKELERALYENTEKISLKKFILNGKVHSSSIKNWLEYFIKINGTDIFDNVVLSSFIAKADNAKILNEKEKKLLYKILIIYRNVKFFPESMPSDDGSGWEIIPLDHIEKESRASQLKHHEKIRKTSLVDELKGNIGDYAPGSLEREILEEESEKDREYHKLLLLSKKYPEGSLERRAVEDEMAKFKK